MPIQKKQHRPLLLSIPFEEEMLHTTDSIKSDLPDGTKNGLVMGKATPFLKWVGGKRSLLAELVSRMPSAFNNYYEPFLGGGALFFEVQPRLKCAYLSDANLDLTITYNVVKKELAKLIVLLKEHKKLHSKEYYYHLRSKHDFTEPVEVAARMIYLNKTCFNGLWRVNKRGEFNVPMGKYVNPGICQEDNLNAVHRVLQKATIEYKDYKLIEPQKGDFVYFDPPYHPANSTSFTAYSSNNFSEKDQADLSFFCTALHKRGVKLMVSNSNTELIHNLYKSSIFKTAIVKAPRMVNCKPNGRNAVEEVLITNY